MREGRGRKIVEEGEEGRESRGATSTILGVCCVCERERERTSTSTEEREREAEATRVRDRDASRVRGGGSE